MMRGIVSHQNSVITFATICIKAASFQKSIISFEKVQQCKKKEKIMKLLVFICFAVVYASAAELSSETKQKMMQKAKELADTCKGSTGATDDDIQAFTEGRDLTTKEAKCLVGCFFKGSGMKFNGGTLEDTNGFFDIIKNENPELHAAKMKIAEECHAEVPKSGDECEYNGKLYECNTNKSKAANLSPFMFSR